MSGPVVLVGYAAVLLATLAKIQPERSVIFVEEPDIVRKRGLRSTIADLALARELIEYEYTLPGKADEFYNCHPDLDPVAIVPVVEYATPFAARLAERYGRPGAGLGAAMILRDKALLRQVSAAAGIANPDSVPVSGPADVLAVMRQRAGPVVLKPANRQASVGTQVIRDPAEVEAAWLACLAQDEGMFVVDRPMELRMLAERFVAGREFSVEMLVQDGRPLFENVTDKYLFPGPRPVECGHSVPAQLRTDLDTLLRRETLGVVEAVGFRTGIVHCEWIISDGVAYLVECAGRIPGGGILDIIQLAYPVELLAAYLAVLKGEPPGELPHRAEKGAAVRFLSAEPGVIERVDGIEEARRADGVVMVHVGSAPGDHSGGVRSSWDRAGVVIATAAGPMEALRRAEAAAGLVRIDVRRKACTAAT